jgi:hypothetical protein
MRFLLNLPYIYHRKNFIFSKTRIWGAYRFEPWRKGLRRKVSSIRLFPARVGAAEMQSCGFVGLDPDSSRLSQKAWNQVPYRCRELKI